MGAWVIFRWARIAVFCFLVLICLTWATLFAYFLLHELSHFSQFQKIIVASLLSLYAFTAILLYLMAVMHFRLWWDVARLFALLIFHSGGSVLFTIYSPRFPCQNFGTETACRRLLHTIFFGCWIVSGIILCFVIALGVMAFIPRPVEPLQGTEEVNAPPTPASFKAGSPTDEQRFSSFYSIDSRTGIVSYNNGGKSPDCTPSPVSSARGEAVTMELPRLWLGFESPNLTHGNNTYAGTMSMRNAPTEHASVVSGPRRVDSFDHNPLGNPSPPPYIHSRASMIRPGVGGKNSSIAEDRLNQSSAFPGQKRGASSPISLHGSSPLATTPRGHATEYTPAIYSVLSHYSAPASPGDRSQREQTYPDRARMVTRTNSNSTFHSSSASVHPMWTEPTPHQPPPPVPTPDIARFRGSPYLSLGVKGAFDPLVGNDVLSPDEGPSEPHRTIQHGALQSYQPPVKENSLSRKGSDGQVLDQSQWRRLVLNAAAKP